MQHNEIFGNVTYYLNKSSRIKPVKLMHQDLYDVVGWTLSATQQILSPLGLQNEYRPPTFAHASTQKGESPVLLQSGGFIDRYESIHVKWMRLQTRKLDLALVMIYPTARPELIPLFAAEWVVIGDKIPVVVLDVYPLQSEGPLQQELSTVYTPLGVRYQSCLPKKQPLPECFAQLAQPWALFSECTIEQLPLLASAFRDYLTAALEGWYLPRQHRCGGKQAAAVHEYKRRRYIDSEGRKLLEIIFGKVFTEEFLRWHCGPPHQPLEL
jgi:hypothetical protein